MSTRYIIPLVLVVTLGSADVASAEGRVELQLVTAEDFPRFEVQNWFRLLKDMKVGGLQIRSARASDKVQIVTAGTKTTPVYRVTGMLTARNELVLPGGKFSIRDGTRINDYFKQLRESGPPSERKTTAFGLTGDQFEAVRKDLARPVTFSTAGKSRSEVLEKIAGQLIHQVGLERGARDALKEAGNLTDEFRGLSYGTVVALLLRPAGMGLLPRRLQGGGVRFEIRGGLTEKQAWPAGHPAQDRRRKLLPDLFKFLDVEVPKDTPMPEALAAISEKLKAPILFDHNALAELDVDLSKATVTVKPQRITPSILVSRLVRAAHPRLLTEVRADERDKPFIWVTIFRVRK